MKKVCTLAVAAMLMTGFAFAHGDDKKKGKECSKTEKKDCCKDNKECKKDEKKEAKAEKKETKTETKATAKTVKKA